MDSPSPEPSHELHDMTPLGGANESPGDNPVPSTPGAEESVPVLSRSGTRNERPRVRFNSSAAESPPPERAVSKDRGEQRLSPSTAKPRPALLRNPKSYESASGSMHDEPLSPEKAKSAAAAAQRAEAIAADAQRHSEADDSEADEVDDTPTPRRELVSPDIGTDESDTNMSPGGYPGLQASGETPQYESIQQTSEAEELLRAHRHLAGSILGGRGVAAENTSDSKLEEGHAVPMSPRGGIFYQILQTYRNPVYGVSQGNGRPDECASVAASSGATTPTRRKWYKQPEEARSTETLSRLIGASAKLANPNLKTDPPNLRKRPSHKRTASGKIMSLMKMAQAEQAKITVHVADILQRQKYILKMCRALMLYGAPSHRLEEYLATTAKVLQIESQFLYIPGCMIISFDDVLTHTTEVKIVRVTQGVNLGKLQDVHLIYKEVLHDVINLDEALSRLDAVMKAKDQWPVWLCVIMYGLASTSVSAFFKARPIDLPVIFVLGTLLGMLQLVIAPISKTYSTVFEVSAAILMTFLSRAIASIRGGSLFCFSALTQSSIAMILPGWLVLSSALELHSKAIVPGSIRMVYAIIYSLFLGYGITVGAALYGAIDPNATTETVCQNTLDTYWNLLFVPLYVLFTTFTVQAKLTQMPVMVAIAQAGYVVNFYTSRKFSASAPIAYTFGAFTIGVLANLYSRIRHGVAAIVLLPAVYVQVPGSLASSGAIVSGLQTATQLVKSNGSAAGALSINRTTHNVLLARNHPILVASLDLLYIKDQYQDLSKQSSILAATNMTQSGQDSSVNAIVFNVAASMIQIAIGITVGLFMSALVVYPLGKRRSGLWTL
ncbi:hypothetical protein F4775DRAFT_588252 [Biscogniauxia sp. FL1348]|nr:hypothetical protein F4775DRAFT_588252 [Biscogniauxia sp. FL1348]